MKLPFTKDQWTGTLGTKNVNGKNVQMCFFHWNSPDGCTFSGEDGKNPCYHSHDYGPDEHHGKNFQQLSTSQQGDIAKLRAAD